MDPRVKTPALGLQQQFTLSKRLYDAALKADEALREVRAARAALRGKSGHGVARQGACRAGREWRRRAWWPAAAGAAEPGSLSALSGQLTQLLGLMQGADVAPTTQAVTAAEAALKSYQTTMARWEALRR